MSDQACDNLLIACCACVGITSDARYIVRMFRTQIIHVLDAVRMCFAHGVCTFAPEFTSKCAFACVCSLG